MQETGYWVSVIAIHSDKVRLVTAFSVWSQLSNDTAVALLSRVSQHAVHAERDIVMAYPSVRL